MPYTPLSDTEIIQRVLAGEKQLFELLMRRYNQRLYRAGMAVLGDASATEEAMQSAWVKAYEHLASFAGRASLATWLTRILLNECLMGQRRQHRFVGLETDGTGLSPAAMTADAPTPVHQALNNELRAALEQAVQGLPSNYRSVFILREVEGMSVAETAHSLGLSEANVKVRLLRAREQLRAQLEDFAPPHAFTYLGPRCDRMVHAVFARLQQAA